MTPKQVRKHYGTPTKFAAATGYTRMVLYNWEKQGKVPIRAQGHLMWLTDGKLVSERARK